jgi:hypothetical protein
MEKLRNKKLVIDQLVLLLSDHKAKYPEYPDLKYTRLDYMMDHCQTIHNI